MRWGGAFSGERVGVSQGGVLFHARGERFRLKEQSGASGDDASALQGGIVHRISFFILIVFFLFSAQAAAQAPLVVSPVMENISAEPYVAYYKDETRALEWRDVLQPPIMERFSPLKNHNTSLGVSGDVWWIRIHIENPNAAPLPWLLEAKAPNTDLLDVYYIQEGRLLRSERSGDHAPFDASRMRGEGFVFSLTSPPRGQGVLLLRMQFIPAGAVKAVFNFWTEREFATALERTSLINGVFLGALLFALLYNVFVFSSTRFKAYLWYNIYLVGMILVYLSLTGMGYRYIWHGSEYITDAAPVLAYVLLLSMMLLFTREFLQTKVMTPRIDLALQCGAWFFFALIALYLLGFRGLVILLLFPGGQVTALFPFLGAYVWRKGKPEARAYFIATIPWFFTVTIGVLRHSGALQETEPVIWATRCLFLLEALLLAFALVDRINIMRREKKQAQRLHRESMEHAKEELERKVAKRTDELKQSMRLAEELARKDPLTGMNNRRSFFELGEKEFLRAKRYDTPLSVMMIDLDSFKRINDEHGHAVGDEVLSALARMIKKAVREGDICGRLGGEEFALILPATELEVGKQIAELLRVAIEGHRTVIGGAVLFCTCSIGVAQASDAEVYLEHSLARADEALYTAKEQGGNAVVSFEPVKAGLGRRFG